MDSGVSVSWESALDGPLELPVLPDAAQQVLRWTAQPDVDLRRLAAILSRDAGLAAHVLRVANSVAYRGREPSVTLQQAISRLGALRLRDVAIVVASEATVFRSRGFLREAKEAFSHALLTALWAQEIARRLKNGVEEAFLCGLLHDVGVPVLLHTALERVPHVADQRAALLAAIEDRHAAAGAELCAAWLLSDRLVTTIRHHHDPLPSLGGTLGAVVALADDLAEWHAACAGSVADDADAARTLEDGIARHPAAVILNLYDDDITALVKKRDVVRATEQELL